MCGIAFIEKKRLEDALENQKDRGHDSLGVIDFENNKLYHAVKKNLPAYDEFLENNIHLNSDVMGFIHHRKASIGEVHLENSHPFIGEKYILAQNGTSREFYETYKNVYLKETDSETLLAHLELNTNTLEECVTMLDSIEDVVGTIFIFSKGKALIWSDSTRETYVEIEDYEFEDPDTKEITKQSFLSYVANYKLGSKLGYKNSFYMIVDIATQSIDLEWHHDTAYNKTYYTSIGVDGVKASKITQMTKKKEAFPYGTSLSKSNGSSIPTDGYYPSIGKTKKKDKQKIGKMNTTRTFLVKDETNPVSKTTILDVYNAVDYQSLLEGIPVDIEIIKYINELTDIFKPYNKNAIEIFTKLFTKIVTEPASYEFFYEAANIEVFNAKNILARTELVDLCPLTFTPYDSLFDKEIIKEKNGKYKKKLNIIRHTKILTQLHVDDVIPYFDAVKYFLYDLPIFKFEVSFQYVAVKPFSLYAYMWLHFSEELPGEPGAMIRSTESIDIKYFKDIRMFIAAGYACNMSDEELWISNALFESILGNVLKDV